MGCGCPARSCLPSPRFGIRRRRIAEALPAQAKISDPRNAASETRPAISVEKDTHGRPPRCQGGRRTRSGSEDRLPFPHTTYWGNVSQAHAQLRKFLTVFGRRLWLVGRWVPSGGNAEA